MNENAEENNYRYVQLQQLANRMRISYFRSIFMRTTLLVEEVYQNKSGIVNLDCRGYTLGSICEKKESRHFNSFGNL